MPLSKCIQKAFWLLCTISLFSTFFVSVVLAEVVLDGTLGQKGSVSGPNYVITDKMGAQVGSNLFHSFETFNINTGESGTFTGPGGTQNVISRVTGGASSWIDGRLGCAIPGANLFLINPYGMMFGPNATLDVNGSFHASTADYLLLGDTGRFDAVNPEQSVLTVDPPSAFGFLDDTAAPIKVDGSYLKVPDGETLSLVGGDITLSNTTLYAPGGEIDLVSVASSGQVTFGSSGPGVDSFERLGEINITRSDADHVKIDDTEIGDVDVSGEGGGVVHVRGGRFVVEGGHVFANTMGDQDSRGGIDVRVRESVALGHSAQMRSWTYGSGDSGDIVLETTDLSLDGGAQISTLTWEGSTGNGGNITIDALGTITIAGKNSAGYPSGIFCNTQGQGDGGDITVIASSFSLGEGGEIQVITFDAGKGGGISIKANELHANGGDIFALTKGSGNAGDIELSGTNLSLTDGAQVNASTTKGSTGNGGNITIDASSVTIAGKSSAGYSSGIFSNTRGNGNAGKIRMKASNLSLGDGTVIQSNTFGSGNGGDIELSGTNLSFTNGAQVSVSSRKGSTGNGGSITIDASSVTIAGKSNAGYSSGIFSSTYGTGSGGGITVTALDLSLGEGGLIQASTNGEGNGGEIRVHADELHVRGGGINANTSGSGNAGDIELSGTNISFTAGAYVDVGTLRGSTGKGGNIIIHSSGTITIAGEDSEKNPSVLLANTLGSGDGGNITIISPNLSLGRGGHIQASTIGEGNGGEINIKANELHAKGGDIRVSTLGPGNAGNIVISGDNLSFTNGAQVGASARKGSTGKGGDITINASGNVVIGGKSTAGDPSGIFSDTHGPGKGGDITVAASGLSLNEGGGISARTYGAGRGGTICVRADELHSKGGVIFAHTYGPGDAGDIELSGTNLLFTGGVRVDVGTKEGSTGNAGSITVNASGSVAITGKDSSGYSSGFFSGTNSVGKGGDISVKAGNITVTDGGMISAESTTTANAGSINIHAGNLLSLDNGTIKTTAKKALGGDITITGKNIQLTHNSSINTSVKSGEGKGGNIAIDATSLVLLEESNIMANADQGYGGDITINADAVFKSPDSKITASSQVHGKEGKISVNSPVQDIVNAMVPLRESFLSADELLPERCEIRDPEQAGSFVVDSDEGLPPRPDELLR